MKSRDGRVADGLMYALRFHAQAKTSISVQFLSTLYQGRVAREVCNVVMIHAVDGCGWWMSLSSWRGVALLMGVMRHGWRRNGEMESRCGRDCRPTALGWIIPIVAAETGKKLGSPVLCHLRSAVCRTNKRTCANSSTSERIRQFCSASGY